MSEVSGEIFSGLNCPSSGLIKRDISVEFSKTVSLLLLEIHGNEEQLYQEMYRRVFESWKKDCLQRELDRAISAGDKNFTIGYAMLQIQLSGGEIHDDSLRTILGNNYPADFTLESFESIPDEVEYYQLNFGNEFYGNIEMRCREIFQRGKKTGSIARADEMLLRFLFSSEELLPISEIKDEYIQYRQSGAPQFFVSKETLLEWIENGRK